LEIFSGLFGRGDVAAEVDDRAWGRAMLDFEAALAHSLAEVGLTPSAAAEEIASACAEIELDFAALGAGAGKDGTPVPALLRAVGEQLSEQALAELHRGATSQDVVDTAAMLVARRALVPLLADLDAAAAAAADLAERHRGTPAAGRTLLQQALPSTFGLKAANWLGGLDEARERLATVSRQRLAVQLGGAAGSMASLGEHGPSVLAALARRLDLAEPTMPWHSNRVRPAELAAALGVAAGAAGKVGVDVALLAQTEVGEVAEGDGGGSSTLPHKRNPVAAVAAIACSRRTPALVATMIGGMGGELERSAGAWQAESETLSELLALTGSAAAAARSLLEGLEVDRERMRTNLDLSGGLLMAEALSTALTPRLGRARAHGLVEAAARSAAESGRPLAETAAEDAEIEAVLGREGIDAALDPASYLGSTDALIDRALLAHQRSLEEE
jgi:3-carboxy-cis,cis-muconate cycloisomerase